MNKFHHKIIKPQLESLWLFSSLLTFFVDTLLEARYPQKQKKNRVAVKIDLATRFYC